MSSKVISARTNSYLDWEISYRLKQKNYKKLNNDKPMRKKNSLGISDEDFRDFLKMWKEKNINF